ncbi:hypothetical protein [Streptomyces turgidiscabies]|uniref:hypothetical protein n=1 Tax=Streptomyces turgidiscabies TaxID=85558 RepID=UPI0038F64F11
MSTMNDIAQLEDQVGLIGGAHGNARNLRDAVVSRTSRGCNVMLHRGDFGCPVPLSGPAAAGFPHPCIGGITGSTDDFCVLPLGG